MIKILILPFLAIVISCSYNKKDKHSMNKEITFNQAVPDFFKSNYDSVLIIDENNLLYKKIDEKLARKCIGRAKSKFMKVKAQFSVNFYENGRCKDSMCYTKPNIIKYYGSAFVMKCNW